MNINNGKHGIQLDTNDPSKIYFVHSSILEISEKVDGIQGNLKINVSHRNKLN